jgi:lytic murein transglycosylase
MHQRNTIIAAPIFAKCAILILAGIGCIQGSAAMAETDRPGSFRRFIEELRPDAIAAHVSSKVFDAAFANVQPDPRVLALTKSQPEYVKPVGSYVVSHVSAGTVSAGRRRMVEMSETLGRIEKNFGVERSILVSIWGLESGYGAVPDNRDIIRSLATLAHARYRDDLFRSELLTALQILEAGGIPRKQLLGSWAGAMGQPQFLPSSFLQYAVDFSGDGQPDIWNTSSDVLASIANYFAKHGWKPGLPWGFEVVIPKGFDYMLSRGSFSEWRQRGLQRADGGAFPADESAYLLFPAGAKGPAFLVTDNFVVIKQYNNSDPYALAVAHLADRLSGHAAFRGEWPQTRPLSREDRIKLQYGLAALGYRVNDFAGHLDFDLRDTIRALQHELGDLPDGEPSPEFLASILSRAGSAPKP